MMWTKTAAAAATTLLALSQTGTARAATPQVPTWIETQVRGLLAQNPGSTRLGSDTVRLDRGVTVRVTTKAAACEPQILCMFEHRDFGGQVLRFFGCGQRNLGRYSMSDGRKWNDKLSSLYNWSGYTARFYNYKGTGDPDNLSNNYYVMGLGQSWEYNLTRIDASEGGGTANDKIDTVKVC